MSSRVSLNSWGVGDSVDLVGFPSSDVVTIKIPYGVDVFITSTTFAQHLFLLGWLKLNLNH